MAYIYYWVELSVDANVDIFCARCGN